MLRTSTNLRQGGVRYAGVNALVLVGHGFDAIILSVGMRLSSLAQIRSSILRWQ